MEKQKSYERESKRTRREVSEILINDDVLEEIMVRLPVKTLILFQLVSKHWRHMITSNSFKEKYMLHHKTKEPKFLFLYDDKSWYEANVTLKTMRLEWSSNLLVEEETEEDAEHIGDDHEGKVALVSKSLDGLICLYGFRDLTRPILVINPATRWSQQLPLARIQLESLDSKSKSEFSSTPGFGKDDLTGTYKLVWLPKNNSCEVFDFRVNQWKQVIPTLLDHHQVKLEEPPTFTNGWLYWFHQDKTKLVAFDLHKEIFRVVPNPITEASSSVDMRMETVDDDRRLVWISVTNGDGMQHVWRLTNHNTGGSLLKMDKMFSFDLNKITSTWFDNTHYSSLLNLAAISKNGNKVMLSKYGTHNLLLYQPLNPTSIHYQMFSYCPSRPEGSVLRHYFPSFASPL